ncbi:hypothetical protein [Palleronia pelagia]|uniref:hypothetical protein n=1 Tax=Palleronia pelagia TaxID=387096 RepID=UPI0011136FD9|nr:hypothetical protein [Palleronia pelagia]
MGGVDGGDWVMGGADTRKDTVTFRLSYLSDGASRIEFVSDDEEAEPDEGSAEEIEESSKVEKLPEVTESDKLRLLSIEWTETALAFFDTIPAIASRSVDNIIGENTESIRKIASEQAVEEREYFDGETSVKEFEIRSEDVRHLINRINRSTHVVVVAGNMLQTTLGAYLSEYEVLLANMLRLMAEIKPEIFAQDDDTISLGELMEFDSVSDARNAVIESKIEKLLLNTGHTKILRELEKKFSVNFTSDKELIAEFTEACQRRHIIAHAGGIVNRRYIDNCVAAGCNPEDLPRIGEQVRITRKYLRRSVARIYQVGYFCLHLLWQKLLPRDLESSRSCVLSDSHEFLDAGLTKMARRLCVFGKNGPRSLTNRERSAFVINHALSYKIDRDMESKERERKIAEVLRSHDWSDSSAVVRLAHACVTDDNENILRFAEMAKLDGLDYYSASSWVVFRDARGIEGFLDIFRVP